MGRRNQKPDPRPDSQSTNPDPSPFNPLNPTNPVKAEPVAPPTFSVGEGISFSHSPDGDTTPGVDTQFSGLWDVLRSHAKPPTSKLPAGAPTLLHEAGVVRSIYRVLT